MSISLKTLAIATSTFACAAMLSFGWSEQAQARTRLYVRPTYYYAPGQGGVGLPWYAVRAYFADGPWSGRGYSWAGWSGYQSHEGIVCTPGTMIKGGDGILYMCQ
jgi:hypothetical protein